MTYVAVEPEKIEKYKDQLGNLHEHREDAIKENFLNDLSKKVEEHFLRNDIKNCSVDQMVNTICDFVNHETDMVRILLGDREET